MKKNPVPVQTAAELLNDLRALVGDAEKMISNNVSEHTAEAVGAMRDRFESAQERLGELGAGVRRKIVAGAKSADDTVRANPYQSIAIAAGAGLLLGVLLGRLGPDARKEK